MNSLTGQQIHAVGKALRQRKHLLLEVEDEVVGAVFGLPTGDFQLGLLVDDWRALALARRARGVADEGRVRRAFGMAFALFVLAIRRGSSLATAMEARGFGSPRPRTWARPSRLRRPDALLIALGALVAAASVIVSVATGHWNFIVG
jgi:energy-coupling factor transport system permease protein